ncbi:hypothetical protein N665_4026s0001 [Sinapis alba]|nr:hypothetical protein N665_4026s0001 [Sinapis alba]
MLQPDKYKDSKFDENSESEVMFDVEIEMPERSSPASCLREEKTFKSTGLLTLKLFDPRERRRKLESKEILWNPTRSLSWLNPKEIVINEEI